MKASKLPKVSASLARECGAGGASAAALEAVPVEGVVPDLGGVVEDASVGGLDELFEGGALERRSGRQLVEVVDIGLVVFAVVVFEGFGGQERFEIVGAEGELREFVCHGVPPSMRDCAHCTPTDRENDSGN